MKRKNISNPPNLKNNRGLVIVNIYDSGDTKETIRTIANVATVIISLCILALTAKQMGWL